MFCFDSLERYHAHYEINSSIRLPPPSPLPPSLPSFLRVHEDACRPISACRNSLVQPPCKNGGTCREVFDDQNAKNAYECDCPVGFPGPRCEPDNEAESYLDGFVEGGEGGNGDSDSDAADDENNDTGADAADTADAAADADVNPYESVGKDTVRAFLRFKFPQSIGVGLDKQRAQTVQKILLEVAVSVNTSVSRFAVVEKNFRVSAQSIAVTPGHQHQHRGRQAGLQSAASSSSPAAPSGGVGVAANADNDSLRRVLMLGPSAPSLLALQAADGANVNVEGFFNVELTVDILPYDAAVASKDEGSDAKATLSLWTAPGRHSTQHTTHSMHNNLPTPTCTVRTTHTQHSQLTHDTYSTYSAQRICDVSMNTRL